MTILEAYWGLCNASDMSGVENIIRISKLDEDTLGQLALYSQETEEHCERVVKESLKLGIELGLSQNQLITLARGASLHDLGKIAIDENILNKPGKLTEEEFNIMKTHSQSGYDALKSHEDVSEDSRLIVLCHHEKWDGTGYPNGLKGQAIPLLARIFAIVDVWDALTSDRPYRLAMSARQAIDTMEKMTNHFDPDIFEVFKTLKTTGESRFPVPIPQGNGQILSPVAV